MKLICNYLFILVLSALLVSCSSFSDRAPGSLHRVSYGEPILNSDPYLDSIRNMESPPKDPPPKAATTTPNPDLTKTSSTTIVTSYVEPIGPLRDNAALNNQQNDLWGSLRKNFIINHHEYNPRVIKQIHWYENHRKLLETLLTNSAPYLYYIYKEIKVRNLPGEFALLPIIESAYDPYAYSYAGASGLWQLMPLTAHDYGTKRNWWYDGRRDIYASTQAALNYLTYLGSFFNEHWSLVLAAYNWGPGALESSINYNARRGAKTDYWSLYMPRQTQLYVPKLLALAVIVEHPSRYGITLPKINNKPYFAAVKVTKQIKLSNAAKLAGTSVKTVEKLNPGYSHKITAPNGTSRLLLPVTNVAVFEQNFHHYAGDIVRAWHDVEAPFRHYQVHAGDTLASIARRFKTTIATLEHSNSVKPTELHPNQVLVIPSKSPHTTLLAANETDITNNETQTDATVNDSTKTTDAPDNPVADDTSHTSTSNKNDIETEPVATTEHYTVHTGDNLWSIAQKYHVTTAEVREWNDLHSNALHVGEKLTLRTEKDVDVDSKVTHHSIHTKEKLASDVVYKKRSYKKLRKVHISHIHKKKHYHHPNKHYRYKAKIHKLVWKKYSGKEYLSHGRKV